MATPDKHAIASASASGRWLNCTAAPTFEAGFPDNPGPYALEGTLAHRICELTVQLLSGEITKRKYNSQIKKCRENEYFNEEMMRTAEFYGQYVWEKVLSFSGKPYQKQEIRVDFSDYVPGGFGTCDCLIIGGDTMYIVDYKHGKGVPVSAENNSQMRLYALGALKQYGFFYDVKKITMAIVQPRIKEDVSEETISSEELLAWGERIKPIAQRAATGIGAEFREGPWCRFCKGRAVCRARADNMTALEDFKDFPIAGKMAEQDSITDQKVLTDKDIGNLLSRGEQLLNWYNDLREYALEAILSGKEIPGWKVVAGRSIRVFDDADAAFDAIRKAGYAETMLYERKPKTLAALEKMIGKTEFDKVVGSHVVKPVGKPTLVDLSDNREPYSSAAADFHDVGGGKK